MLNRVPRQIAMLLCLLLLACATDTIDATEFDAHHAFEVLEKQCSFGARVPGTESHQKCLDYLVQMFRDYSDRVELQSFVADVDKKSLPLTNVLASFGPEDSPHWLLAAHWDSRPTADQDPNPKNHGLPVMGANDGASGVAILVELARIFHDTPPPVPTLIVLFDGEDYGPGVSNMFIGSKHYAERLANGSKAKQGILLDMVGDSQLTLPIERYSYQAAPSVVNHVWETAKRLGFAAFEERMGPSIQDDHLPLIQAGIPCIDIIDFDYSYWHTIEDTPDKCSAASLYVVGQVVLSVVYGR